MQVFIPAAYQSPVFEEISLKKRGFVLGKQTRSGGITTNGYASVRWLIKTAFDRP
jgi:hypothetical protein